MKLLAKLTNKELASLCQRIISYYKLHKEQFVLDEINKIKKRKDGRK
jgi:hypothetical protein